MQQVIRTELVDPVRITEKQLFPALDVDLGNKRRIASFELLATAVLAASTGLVARPTRHGQ